MKTKNFLMYGMVAFALIATSCDEKSDDGGDDYSPIPVEQHKTNIEDAGSEMFDEVKGMEDEPAMQANISLATLLGDSDPFADDGMKKVTFEKTIAFAPVYASANYNETGLKGMAKSVQINPAEDPESIQALYDDLVGLYEWNASISDWDYTDTGDKIVFMFPSEQDGPSNNAKYTVSYTGYTGPNPLKNDADIDYDGDLPQNVSAILEVDDAEVSSFTVDIVYNGEGYPTSIEGTLSLGSYVWYAMASNTNNAAFATELSFKDGDKILLKLTLDASGNWTKENIENNWEETYYAEWYDEETGYYEYKEIDESEMGNYDYTWSEDEFNIHKVIKNGNASFQAMNLKIKGSIAAENFGDKMKEIDEAYDWDTQEKEAIDAQIEAMNQYVSLSLRYADTDDVIAMVEAYPVEREDTYTDWVYNETTGNYDEVEVTETYYDFDMRFVFADGSKVDFETYFDDIFSDLFDEIETWANELEDTYNL